MQIENSHQRRTIRPFAAGLLVGLLVGIPLGVVGLIVLAQILTVMIALP